MSLSGLRHISEWVACALAVAVAVLTVATPTWIEYVFGADPDQGSGITEWAITLGAIAAAVGFALLARWDYRRATPVRA